MQSVTMTVTNSGTDKKGYRAGDLTFNIGGSTNKSVTISLPDDAAFILWVVADSELSFVITYGQNDPKTVIIVDGDYTVDPLDGVVVMDSAHPQQIIIPLAATMFDGDADGGVGNLTRILRTSGVLTVKPSGTEKIDGNSVPAGVAGYLTCGTGEETNVATWVAVTDGEFAVDIDNVAYDIIGIDFSAAHPGGAVTDLAGVATRIEEAIQAATGLPETVVYTTIFTISSSVARVSGNVSVLSAVAAGAGTDISGAGGAFLDGDVGGTAVSAVAGLGGYPVAAAGSVLIQALHESYRAVGGTTAFS